MIDRYKKLVAVAEDMAAEWNEKGMDVCGMEVHVEGHGGIIKLGQWKEYSVYYPDENQYMPEYGMDYRSYYYSWIDQEWVKDEPMVVEVREREDWVDELPELPF